MRSHPLRAAQISHPKPDRNPARLPTIFIVSHDPRLRKSIALALHVENIPAETFHSAETFLQVFDRDRAGCVLTEAV